MFTEIQGKYLTLINFANNWLACYYMLWMYSTHFYHKSSKDG